MRNEKYNTIVAYLPNTLRRPIAKVKDLAVCFMNGTVQVDLSWVLKSRIPRTPLSHEPALSPGFQDPLPVANASQIVRTRRVAHDVSALSGEAKAGISHHVRR